MCDAAESQARHAWNDSAAPADNRADYAHTTARKSCCNNDLSIIHHHVIASEARQSPSFTNPKGFAVAAVLLAAFMGRPADCAEPPPLEQALAAVRDRVAHSPAPWPDTWQQEYAQTIREVVTPHQETPNYDKRLAIPCNGFRPYWEALKKTQERSLFEIHCAEIRWYVECLMDAELPGDEETNALRNQYEDLF